MSTEFILVMSIVAMIGAATLCWIAFGLWWIEAKRGIATALLAGAAVVAVGGFKGCATVKEMDAAAAAHADAVWRDARCPMYKSECGHKAKNKYACERRGAVVGRNIVGDIAVDAYPTC